MSANLDGASRFGKAGDTLLCLGGAGAAPLAAAAPAVRGLAGITGKKNGRPANLIPQNESRMPN